MKETINILFIIFSYTLCFSQTIIDLKIIPFEIKNQNFYIDKVFDDRQEMYLSFIEDNSEKKVTLRLKYSLSVTVKKFMDTALPKTGNKTPIIIRINDLKIEQAQTSIDKRTARIYIELSFYSESGDKLYKIAHYENQVFPLSSLKKINETHEQRIRAALEYCLWGFINRPKADLTNNTVKGINSGNKNFTVKESDFEPYIPLGKWYNILSIKRVLDKYNEGWEVAYTGFLDNEKDFIIPFEIAYSQSNAKSDLVKERNYSSVNAFTLGFGLNGYIKIVPGLYVDLGLNVPIGIEVLRDLQNKKSTNFLIGLTTHQGVKIIPWKGLGIVIGTGLFQRLQTSKIENRNFGFELELGINF